jgi:hypothetical protein
VHFCTLINGDYVFPGFDMICFRRREGGILLSFRFIAIEVRATRQNRRIILVTKLSSFAVRLCLRLCTYGRAELLTLTQPINDGVVTDWDDYELLFTGICERLRVDVADFGVLLVESPLNKHANRERMTQVGGTVCTQTHERHAQIMFETFNVRRMYVEVSGVLSLYSSGRVTGCVIESGQCAHGTFSKARLPCIQATERRT